MALTDTQRANAAILKAQGDTPEQIAHLIGATVADLPRELLTKRAPKKSTTPPPANPDEPPVDPEGSDSDSGAED